MASKMQDIQNELDICEEAKKAVADVNPLTTHFRSVILFFFWGVGGCYLMLLIEAF